MLNSVPKELHGKLGFEMSKLIVRADTSRRTELKDLKL